jgi:hypothetical protein
LLSCCWWWFVRDLKAVRWRGPTTFPEVPGYPTGKFPGYPRKFPSPYSELVITVFSFFCYQLFHFTAFWDIPPFFHSQNSVNWHFGVNPLEYSTNFALWNSRICSIGYP